MWTISLCRITLQQTSTRLSCDPSHTLSHTTSSLVFGLPLSLCPSTTISLHFFTKLSLSIPLPLCPSTAISYTSFNMMKGIIGSPQLSISSKTLKINTGIFDLIITKYLKFTFKKDFGSMMYFLSSESRGIETMRHRSNFYILFYW